MGFMMQLRSDLPEPTNESIYFYLYIPKTRYVQHTASLDPRSGEQKTPQIKGKMEETSGRATQECLAYD